MDDIALVIKCRPNDVDPELTAARLWLVEAARTVLASSLSIVGVSAPEEL